MSNSEAQPNPETELATTTAHLIGLYTERNKLQAAAVANNHSLLPLMQEVFFTNFSQAPTWLPERQAFMARALRSAIERVEWEVDVMVLLAKFAAAVKKLDDICATEVGGAQQQQWKETYPLLDLDATLQGVARFNAQEREAAVERIRASVNRLENLVAVLEQMSWVR